MEQITKSTSELNNIRNKMLDQEEILRIRDNQTQKLTTERDHLLSELKKLETAYKEMKVKFDDQTRLLTSVTAHKKNPMMMTVN